MYSEDRTNRYPIRLFVHGDRYKFWSLFETDLHLFGVGPEGRIFLFGTDRMGRDLLSRILYGARISLSIGLIGVFLSFVLGLVLGGISGYFGGLVDTLIQRLIEIIRSVPDDSSMARPQRSPPGRLAGAADLLRNNNHPFLDRLDGAGQSRTGQVPVSARGGLCHGRAGVWFR